MTLIEYIQTEVFWKKVGIMVLQLYVSYLITGESYLYTVLLLSGLMLIFLFYSYNQRMRVFLVNAAKKQEVENPVDFFPVSLMSIPFFSNISGYVTFFLALYCLVEKLSLNLSCFYIWIISLLLYLLAKCIKDVYDSPDDEETEVAEEEPSEHMKEKLRKLTTERKGAGVGDTNIDKKKAVALNNRSGLAPMTKPLDHRKLFSDMNLNMSSDESGDEKDGIDRSKSEVLDALEFEFVGKELKGKNSSDYMLILLLRIQKKRKFSESYLNIVKCVIQNSRGILCIQNVPHKKEKVQISGTEAIIFRFHLRHYLPIDFGQNYKIEFLYYFDLDPKKISGDKIPEKRHGQQTIECVVSAEDFTKIMWKTSSQKITSSALKSTTLINMQEFLEKEDQNSFIQFERVFRKDLNHNQVESILMESNKNLKFVEMKLRGPEKKVITIKESIVTLFIPSEDIEEIQLKIILLKEKMWFIFKKPKTATQKLNEDNIKQIFMKFLRTFFGRVF